MTTPSNHQYQPCSFGLRIRLVLVVLVFLCNVAVLALAVWQFVLCRTRTRTDTEAFHSQVASELQHRSDQLSIYNAATFSTCPASAHRRLVPPVFKFPPPPTFNETDEYIGLTHEEKIRPWLEHTRNIKVSKSGMTVLIPGLYQVYSSLAFQPNSAEPCRNFAKQTWEHVVILTSTSSGTGQERHALLNKSHTCCDSCIGNQATSYSGGLFELGVGDHLHVEVAGEGIVSFKPEGTFMGMFLFQPRPL